MPILIMGPHSDCVAGLDSSTGVRATFRAGDPGRARRTRRDRGLENAKAALEAAFVRGEAVRGQRFENCLRLRALWRPTFLRSTSRASRVTSPAFDSVGFSAAS